MLTPAKTPLGKLFIPSLANYFHFHADAFEGSISEYTISFDRYTARQEPLHPASLRECFIMHQHELIQPVPFIAAHLQQCAALMVSPAAWNGSSTDITDPPDGPQDLL